MNPILCIEIDLASKIGGKPLTDEGPMAQFARTGRWSLLKDEGLDLLRINDGMKAQLRASRKAFLLVDTFIDFFGPPQEESASDQAVVVRVQD